jgi:hypothetical protein
MYHVQLKAIKAKIRIESTMLICLQYYHVVLLFVSFLDCIRALSLLFSLSHNYFSLSLLSPFRIMECWSRLHIDQSIFACYDHVLQHIISNDALYCTIHGNSKA